VPVAAAVVAGVLLLGGVVAVGAMYALDVGPFAFPERYLLEEDEYPSGMRKASLDAWDAEDFGVTSNPGQVADAKLDELPLQPPPDEAWMQGLETTRGGQVVAVAAAQFASEDDAKGAITRLRAGCSFGIADGIVGMRDGDVVVVVMGKGAEAETYVAQVAKAIQRKAGSDLVTAFSC
ncbi:MAG TPA: hypothetical protein VHH36_08995, partial [Candidatus Thermoplasmatota archaeon]|nr:hypothetical protein [Candidatus Thermoplasmatota archaeon]